jgi:hypothetical protein
MSDKPPIIDYASPRPPVVVDYANPKPAKAIRPPGPLFGVLLAILLAVVCLIGLVLLFTFG